MSVKRQWTTKIGTPLLLVALLLSAACTQAPTEIQTISSAGINPDLKALAIREVRKLQANGQRVWCVPFARGNANTWWGKAEGSYARGKKPVSGAVMAFTATSSNPMGHIAVVSEVVTPREIRVDHANWKRDKISLRMSVIDVSDANDWSKVRLESQEDSYGRVYPVTGFIYPDSADSWQDKSQMAPVFAFAAAPLPVN